MNFTKDELTVEIYSTRREMGESAAKEVSSCIHKLLQEKDEINMIFAAAPSQNEFLEALTADTTIEWTKINAFHMDEYIGLKQDAPQGFGNFLKERLFDRIPFKSVSYIDGQTTLPHVECARYSKLLKDYPVDIVCLGIGENGHIAFNDPHVADFNDPRLVKVVSLDEKCRMQQVHDGCFSNLSEVPTHAFTLTIPALVSARFMYCIVPAKTKSQAVYNTINGEISEICPASILRRKQGATLYLDADSASLLKQEIVKLKINAL
ncbi:glucosamine-6-phosphate deaminase [Parabacteroides chinchillae]|uniref:Glucosamine-6-phosphate deaminase n=1 Tax=Parabacteroides chinchillae TaxID=871327 RepID=A0A8G2BU94_9BACT|nr:glucosamine-6-phosphate deaminase [Parabacteroides chinchillae]SEF52577.1 glucosamine-6-phosphate deaminase [Parabacteroides chinchillae]